MASPTAAPRAPRGTLHPSSSSSCFPTQNPHQIMANFIQPPQVFAPHKLPTFSLIHYSCQIMSKLLAKLAGFLTPKIAPVLKPPADLTWVSVKKMSREAVELQCDVEVTNHHNHSLPISQISYKFKSDNREIASGEITNPGFVRARDKTAVKLPIKVPYGCLLTIVKDIAADWDIDYEMDVALIVDLPIIGNFTIPLSKQGTLTLFTLPLSKQNTLKLPTVPALF